jgi:phosphatidylinositol phospholipase C, delta
MFSFIVLENIHSQAATKNNDSVFIYLYYFLPLSVVAQKIGLLCITVCVYMMVTPNYYQHLAREAQYVKAVITASTSSPPETSVNIDQPSVTLKSAMMTLVSHRQLQKGINVMRITSRGVWKPRVVTLSQDKFAFFVTHRQVPSSLPSTVASKFPIPLWTPTKGFHLSNKENRYIRHLDIADIDAWQVGVIGAQLLEYFKTSVKEKQICELVTVFHHGFKPICFRIPNKENLEAFVNALPQMKNRYNLIVSFIARDQVLLRYISYDIDVDKNGSTSLSEFAELCKRINLVLPNRNEIFENYAEKSSRKKSSKEISNAETRELLHYISLKDTPAAKVWDQVFGKQQFVGPDRLRKDFLLSVQKEANVTLEDAELLIQSVKTMGYSKDDDKHLSKQEFLEYLTSKFNDAYDPAARLPLETKLDQPLPHYWINTSHNTYLTGDQLTSRSSVVAYVDALFRGCKCLEIDCWDGYEDKKNKTFVPVVFHGHTMTSKIDVESILYVVDNYLNDHPSSYPIILSLENHCSHPYQKAMAIQMKKIFGKKLYIPTRQQLSAGQNLPSPEELRGMIVIKGKRPPDTADQVMMKNGKQLPPLQAAGSVDEENDGDEEDEIVKNISKIHSDLALLTLFHGCKHKDFCASMQQPPSHMHSIGEGKITKILDKSPVNAKMWREYNVQHMTRTYPAGTRIDSSNYNPLVAWAMGCQLVALNFQTSDTPLLLNDGRFRQGGGCGYLLKPPSVMGKTSRSRKNTISIKILSALCLPKPKGAKDGEIVDPYIKVELHDVSLSKLGKEEYMYQSGKTSVVDNNGFCPSWRDASFSFDVSNPDVAMLMFEIVDQDYDVDDIICSSAIPVSCLRKGYRSVQLYDDHGTTSGPFECATLFVHIQ